MPVKLRCASLLTVLILAGTWSGALEPKVEVITPGLEHHVMVKGEASDTRGYRILVGVFEYQSEATRTLERLVDCGVAGIPESEGHEYWIVTPSVADREQAEATKRFLIECGFPESLEIQELTKDPSAVDGPWRIHVLIADPGKIIIRVAHSLDAAIGLETTPELAVRKGALAAINGGYYRMKGLLAGDSQGVLQIDGALLSEPDRGRGAVGFFEHEGTTRSVFGRLSFRGEAVFENGERVAIDGINRPRKASEIVLYTTEFHRTTLTSPAGAEIVIRDSEIIEIREESGSSVIPSDGVVLSVGDERISEILPRLQRRQGVTVETTLVSLLPDSEGDWDKAESIVGGGPLLLRDGQRLEEPEKESISRVFFRARHPRTAVGVRADGTLLFVTVDGRQPGESVGMSIPELIDLMTELGCVSAVNLDGGGSTTMVIEGEIVNTPTDADGARRNADAILLFPRRVASATGS